MMKVQPDKCAVRGSRLADALPPTRAWDRKGSKVTPILKKVRLRHSSWGMAVRGIQSAKRQKLEISPSYDNVLSGGDPKTTYRQTLVAMVKSHNTLVVLESMQLLYVSCSIPFRLGLLYDPMNVARVDQVEHEMILVGFGCRDRRHCSRGCCPTRCGLVESKSYASVGHQRHSDAHHPSVIPPKLCRLSRFHHQSEFVDAAPRPSWLEISGVTTFHETGVRLEHVLGQRTTKFLDSTFSWNGSR